MIKHGFYFFSTGTPAGSHASSGGIEYFIESVAAVLNSFFNGFFVHIVALANDDFSFLHLILLEMSRTI